MHILKHQVCLRVGRCCSARGHYVEGPDTIAARLETENVLPTVSILYTSRRTAPFHAYFTLDNAEISRLQSTKATVEALWRGRHRSRCCIAPSGAIALRSYTV